MATMDLLPLDVRASVAPKSANEEQRTVELTVSTGAPVERVDFMSGQRYTEKLVIAPSAIRLERLNDGAPLLDSHNAAGLSSQIGVVLPGSARITNGELRATVQFSKREAVEPIWQDVRDGVIRNVSVGYRVHEFELTPKKSKLDIRRATSWEPFEVSMVAIGADAGARVRKEADAFTNRAQVIGSETMPEEKVTQPVDGFVAEPETRSDFDSGVQQEQARIKGIHSAVRAARLPYSFAEKLIDEGLALLDAQTRVFGELGKSAAPAAGPKPAASSVSVEFGEDNSDKQRAGIENAILHRAAPASFKLTDEGREYRGLSLLDMARSYLQSRGVRVNGLSKTELAGVALGLSQRGGMHTTSDFPEILADAVNKTLRASYDAAPQTFAAITRRVTVSDFKNINRLQLGEAPALSEVLEHGEYTRGTIAEAKETYALKTYGKVFAITRKALVNDDLESFSRVASSFGQSARNLESDLAWAQITSNPTMGDGNALFSSAHGNDGSPAVISVASISEGRAAMRIQKGLDGATFLNLSPAHLIVPAVLETEAQQLVAGISPNTSGSVNPFSGNLQVIAEPRLDADDTEAWYLAASTNQVDILEMAGLEGEQGPSVESRLGFDVDGLEIKCRHDVAAKVIDYRGLFKNDGDTV